jgi:hypothetical protein
MKLLNHFGAIVSIAFFCGGIFLLWQFGLHGRGPALCAAASGSGFALSITLCMFQLRRRIDGLERQQNQSGE